MLGIGGQGVVAAYLFVQCKFNFLRGLSVKSDGIQLSISIVDKTK